MLSGAGDDNERPLPSLFLYLFSEAGIDNMKILALKHTLVRGALRCLCVLMSLVATDWPWFCCACLALYWLRLVHSRCVWRAVVLSGRFGDVRPDLKTMSGGEFDWGGTSVKS